MNRAFTGIIVLSAIVLSILFLAQPWNSLRGINEAALKLGLDLQGGLRVVLQAEGGTPTPEDLDTARNVIENRVNQFGVAEPLVQTSGNNRIVVELPGLSSADQSRAADLIGQSAVLEFRIVKSEANNKADEQLLPEDLEDVAFTGEILSDARADFNNVGGATIGGAVVLFDIKSEFADDFQRFTTENRGRRMAIVLDGVVKTAPTIQNPISNNGQITGVGALEEASDIALVLRSGSLPINLRIEETRAIGPTLGQDAINSGTRSGIIGGVAVVLVVLFYYGPLFGGVLTVGLLLSMLFIFAALAGFGATLTLPGLAGLILTIGSALDGNVISFERVKENLRGGKGLKAAMKDGFNNSLPAIIDANMAAVLAGLALYQYTTGPVRGFAVTLIIGIVASVFSNIVVVPFLLNVITTRMQRHYIPMGFSVPRIRFMKMAPTVLTISAVLAVAALGLVFIKGLKQSVDFTGGTTALYQVNEATTVDDVRRAIDALAVEGINSNNATIQEVDDATISNAAATAEATTEETVTEETATEETATETTATEITPEAAGTDTTTTNAATKLISVRVGETANQEAGGTFANDLATSLNASLLSTDFVGPSVGSDLRLGAFYAMLVAFGLILAYVGFRFWPNWIVAVAAVIAAVHDVGIVMGALSLFNVEFSIPVLAALLFVVGYSLNDSIIIADRLRENLRKTRGQSYADIAELSVNQTLSRTIMTSGLTLIPIVALLIFGGSVLRDFSITLLIGLAFGTYSSIFVLSPIVVWFRNRFSKGGTSVPKAV
ncbi:MAG: protein translocase subunit SecD [Trueperaceae bacterium]